MNWELKARIQKTCATIPLGEPIYRRIQRTFGTADGSPMDRFDHFVRMAEWLRDADLPLVGARCLEVGTGHKATLPLLFALCGAESVTTIDLHPRLQDDLMLQVIAHLLDDRASVEAALARVSSTDVVAERLDVLARHRNDVRAAMAALGVAAVAPGDAASTGLPDHSIDIHFSTTVFEHIPLPVLEAILGEGRRIVRPGGALIHFIDLSDHFAHQDRRIVRTNFLRFSERDWSRIAGNQFGYCNRARSPEFLALVDRSGLDVVRCETLIDDDSLDVLRRGELPLDPTFERFSPEELAVVELDLLLRAA